MFETYGWKRAGAFSSRGNTCGFATKAVREAFTKSKILMTEWAVYDEEKLTDELIQATVRNLKYKARSKILLLIKRSLSIET